VSVPEKKTSRLVQPNKSQKTWYKIIFNVPSRMHASMWSLRQKVSSAGAQSRGNESADVRFLPTELHSRPMCTKPATLATQRLRLHIRQLASIVRLSTMDTPGGMEEKVDTSWQATQDMPGIGTPAGMNPFLDVSERKWSDNILCYEQRTSFPSLLLWTTPSTTGDLRASACA
jgi:hypothetical protein